MSLVKLVYFYSKGISDLSKQRIKFQHKICFKHQLNYLKLKSTPSISMATRLMTSGRFLKMYKLLLKAYLNDVIPNALLLPDDNDFKTIFMTSKILFDLNNALSWKIFLLNVLFNLKKLNKNKIVYYLKPERRAPLTLSWLKSLIKAKKKSNHNCSNQLFIPLFLFLTKNTSETPLFYVKLKIYQFKLLRGD